MERLGARRSRRIAAVLLVGALVGAVLALRTTTPARAGAPIQVQRLAGPDRIATAIAISQQEFPTASSAPAVVLTRSDNFADALAGTPFAATEGAPLLLTPPGSLDPSTATEIGRVASPGAAVFLLGGTAALSDAVGAAITALGHQPLRLAGANRYGTAAQVATALASNLPTPTIFLADGTTFADALIAGSVSGGVRLTGPAVPLLLTAGSVLPAETQAFLAAQGTKLTRIETFGSAATTAYPSGTADVAADDATLSAVVAAKFFVGFPMSVVGIASDKNFPDALAGGVWTALKRVPLLLTDPTTLSPAVRDYLGSSSTSNAVVFGGTSAVGDTVVGAVSAISPTGTTTTSTSTTRTTVGSASNFGAQGVILHGGQSTTTVCTPSASRSYHGPVRMIRRSSTRRPRRPSVGERAGREVVGAPGSAMAIRTCSSSATTTWASVGSSTCTRT